MERDFWLARNSVAAMMARQATPEEARLIRCELGDRHSSKAAGARPASPWKEGDAA